MRILHVINCIEIGGAETFLLRLMKELENQGHVNFLMTLSHEQNSMARAAYKQQMPRTPRRPSQSHSVAPIGSTSY